MASRNIHVLTTETSALAQSVIDICKEHGVDLVVYCTVRKLTEQARLYRKGRSYREIKGKMNDLEKRGFGFLAEIIELVGAQTGEKVTNAAPGESWHNYGEAFDAVPLIDGKAAWDYKENKEQWEEYGRAVRQVGMNWGGDWSSFKDYPHAQLRSGSNPLKYYPPSKIRAMLKENNLIE